MRSLALNEVRRLDGQVIPIVIGIVDDAIVDCFEKELDRLPRRPVKRASRLAWLEGSAGDE